MSGRRRTDDAEAQSMESDRSENEIRDEVANSRDLVAGLRRELPTVLLVAALVTVASLIVSMALPRRYTSAASVVLEGADLSSSTIDVNMATEKQVASSVTVAQAVIRDLSLDATPEGVLGGLSLSVPVDTDVLVFSYTAADPKLAQRLAQAFADAYLSFRRQELLQSVSVVSEAVDDRIQTLRTELTTATEKAARQPDPAKRAALHVAVTSLLAQIGVQEQRAASATDGLRVTGGQLAAATLPTHPSQPRALVNTLVGLILGSMLGVLVAAGRSSFGKRVRTQRDMAGTVGSAVIAVIPRRRGLRRSVPALVDDLRSPPGAAYRRLAAKLLAGFIPSWSGYGRSSGAGFSIAVVGLEDQTDTAVVVANLGSVIARSGRNVIVASAAADGHGLEAIFGVRDQPGVRDVVGNTVPLHAVLHETGIASLALLPGGSVVLDLALLDSAGVRHTVDEMTRIADVVIVDAPARALTDATALVVACDAVVVVGSLRTTSFEDAGRARRELEALGTPVLGVVVFEGRSPARALRGPDQPSGVEAPDMADVRRDVVVGKASKA